MYLGENDYMRLDIRTDVIIIVTALIRFINHKIS